MERTVVVTGSASGMGAATKAILESDGVHVIGVDREEADVVADLETPEGRAAVADAICAQTDRLDGIATFAGLSGLPGRPGGLVASVNYFGTVELVEALHPLLRRGTDAAVLAVSSNSTTTSPNIPFAVVDACLAGDEAQARALADQAGSLAVYPATKIAIARWVRRNAPTSTWIGSGITLNALAPGSTATAMTAAVAADPVLGPLSARFPKPLGRQATAHELGEVAAFLLGPKARVFCGSVIFCDGGTDAFLRPDDWPMPPTDHESRNAR